jgi:diadenylate cyclase
LERIGRVGSLRWISTPSGAASAERVAGIVARTAGRLSAARTGALIVIERDTGLGDTAETGVMLNADLSEELLASLFAPHAALHDGAVVIRDDRLLAAAVVLPMPETSVTSERVGTRHRAAIGITEQTDAIAVVVSEETGRISLVERGRVLRDLDQDRLRVRLVALLRPPEGRGRAAAGMAAISRGKRPRVRDRRPDRRSEPTTSGGATPAVAVPPGTDPVPSSPTGRAE